jgi:hypothetical protein
MRSVLKYSAVLVASLCMFSCSVQKRVYMKGYYVPGNTTRSKFTDKKDEPALTIVTRILQAETANCSSFYVKEADRKCPPDTCKDIIYFNSGMRARVKILKDSAGTVDYIICEKQNGKIYRTPKRDIAGINNVSAVATAPQEPSGPRNYPKSLTWSGLLPLIGIGLAIVGAFTSVFAGFFIIAVLCQLAGFAFSIISLVKIITKNKKYRGLGIAILLFLLTALLLFYFIIGIFWVL